MKMLTTQEAAKRLGISDARVRTLILAGRLPADKFGRAHLIREEDLKLVANRRHGRPPMSKTIKGKTAPAHKKSKSK